MKSSKFQVPSSDCSGASAAAANHYSVNYQWTGADGMICRGHSVTTGRNRAHAERKFFRMNRHVFAGGEA